MANQFYDPGAQRAEKVRTLFDRIASRYDLMNDIQSFGLHRRWKQQVLNRADPHPGDRALDVCCGTGDLANALAKAGAVTTGLDFSHEMLARAAKRTISSKLDFIQGDAQNLPFSDSSFDIVTIGYGLRNLADWQKGIIEMTRVLKPGGRLVILEFGRPDARIWRTIYFGYLRLFVPALGLVFCGSLSAYSYILESLKHYPGQEAVAQKMRELGLAANNTNILAGAMTITCGAKSGGLDLQKDTQIRQNC
jgi:demethylmenaquinone methyltransferase/2-methoxy-6-polyprenyl-1,4-benzoquinol methylase